MFPIKKILERKEILPYLESRGLLRQYKKAKEHLLSGMSSGVHFKKRQPKHDSVWYFRINRQYRAIGYFDGDSFIVVEIDNHQ